MLISESIVKQGKCDALIGKAYTTCTCLLSEMKLSSFKAQKLKGWFLRKKTDTIRKIRGNA